MWPKASLSQPHLHAANAACELASLALKKKKRKEKCAAKGTLA